MKRTFAIILAALAAAALFGGLVYAVLVAAHVSEPAATTVYGLTLRRLWATTGAALAALCFSFAEHNGATLALALGAGFAATGSVMSFLRLTVAPRMS